MTNVSLDVVAFDKASQALLKVAERFDRLIDKAERLDRKRVNVRVDADTRRADEAFDKIGRKASKLDNTQISYRVDGDKALTVLSLIGAGLATIGHLAPAAVGAVAAAPAALGVLAQGAGAVAISLSGVGDGVDALTKAEEGLAKGGEEAAAAQEQLDAEMEKLTPAARSLAAALHGGVVPALHDVRSGVQSTGLPRFEVSLERLTELAPAATVGLSGTSKVIGDLAMRGAAMATSGPWRKDFAAIMRSNNRSLDDFGTSGLHALDMTRSLTVASLPLVERLSQATLRGAELANQYIETARESGRLEQVTDQAGDTLAEFAQTALQVLTGVTQLAMALGPMGGILLDVVGGLVEFIGDLASAHPTLVQFAAGAILATTVVTKLGTGIAGLVATAGAAKAGWLALGGAMASVHGRVDRAIGSLSVGRTAAQGFAEGLGGAAGAADRATVTGGRFSSTAAKVGASLPILGVALVGVALAYDHASSSADEAAAAIARGGDEAIAKVRELQAVDEDIEAHGFGNWIGFLHNQLRDLVGVARPGLDGYRESVSGVEKAQLAAAEAAAHYQDTIVRVGPGTAEASAAYDAMTVAVDDVEAAQREAGDATAYHTRQLVEQQNIMLAAVDKDLGFRASLLAVEQAQKTLAEAVRDHGAASLEGRQASLQYEEALFRSVTALGENVRAQNADRSASEQNRLAVQAQKDEIFRLVSAAGGAAPPALARMAGGMSNADLTARGATVSVNNLGQRVVALPNGKTIVIEAETAGAQSRLNSFIDRNDGRTITIYTQMAPSGVPIRQLGGGATGALVQPMAVGGIKSMSNRFAQIVPPNTPRLIGDRIRGDEFFLPDDEAPRSLAIGAEWARRRRLQLVPAGKVASRAGATITVGPVYLSQAVDVDMLADRLAFKATAASFG